MLLPMRSWLALAVCVACAAQAPPGATRVTVEPPARASAAPLGDPIPTDPPAAYAFAWEHWRTGHTDEALRAFRVVLDAALAEPQKGRHTPPPKIEPRVSAEIVLVGDRAALVTRDGALVAKASGALERFVPFARAYRVAKTGGGLFAVISDAVGLVDATTGAFVARVDHAEDVRIVGERHFVVFGADDHGAFVELWDLASQKRVSVFRDPGLQAVMTVDLSPDDRALVACGGGHCATWDVASGAVLASFDENPNVNGAPAFSSDNRWIAWGTTDFSKPKLVGTTFLYDRAAHKVTAQSHASPMPTGFAFTDKWLAVGDLRRACLLRLPTLAKIACSAEVRPNAGIDDDLQDAHPTFVASVSALAIETSDGSTLVARVPAMTTTWKGRARLDGAYLVDGDAHVLYAIGPSGVVTRVRALAADETTEDLPETHPHKAEDAAAYERVTSAACHVGDWIFPAAACTKR